MADYYPSFGKDPDTMRVTFRAFSQDLAAYSPSQITNAFREWRQKNNQAPLSSDILKILNCFPEPRKTSPEHKVEKIDYEYREKSAEIRAKNKVYWFGKNYDQMDAKTLEDVKIHIGSLFLHEKNRAHDYCLFLHSMCGFPKDFYKEIFQ